VETAVVLVLVLTFVFAIIEYGRFMMDWTLLNNAAREGCRYAMVNNTDVAILTKVQGVVNTFMAGETKSFTGSTVTVTVTGKHNGVSTPVIDLTPGDEVTVTLTGTYRFLNIIPMVTVPTALSISSAVTMGCEGAT
jgi:Flp pilus assembly protein TadG